MKYYLLFHISAAVAYRGFAQDVATPNRAENSHSEKNEPEMGDQERGSFSVNARGCPRNMVSYPGPGARVPWICGCEAGFLYLPSTSSCHEAFRQGPCPPGQYVYLAVDGVVPGCATNPCSVDGLVPYKGVCYPVERLGAPCANDGFLFVNGRTFQVECISISRAWPVAHVIVKAPNSGRNDRKCPPGTRRDTAGVCKKPIP